MRNIFLTLLILFIQSTLPDNVNAQISEKKIIYCEYGYNDYEWKDTILTKMYGNEGWEYYYWGDFYYPNFNSLSLDSNVCMLFLANNEDNGFTTLLYENISEIESWVESGGNLFLYSKFNEGDTIVDVGFDNTFFYTYDDILCSNNDCPKIVDSSHVIFSGPFYPVDFPSLDAYYKDTYIGCTDCTILIIDSLSNNPVMIEKTWGAGKIIFASGGILFPSFDYLGNIVLSTTYQTNTLWYLSGCLHQQDDLGVIEVNNPFDKCHLTNTEEIQITIRNYGDLDKTNFNISYQVNDGEVVTEFFTDTIAGGFTGDYTFTTTADLTGQRFNSIKTWTTDALDTVPKNDTLIYKVKSFTPFSSTGFPSLVCPADSLITATPEFYPGIWSGDGITDSITGTFDPAIVGVGNSTEITYTYSIPVTYQMDSIAFAPYEDSDPTYLTLIGADEEEKIPIGFPFQFFNHVYDSLWVDINGFLSFDGYYIYSDEPPACYCGDSLTDLTYFDNYISVCAADLSQGVGSLSYETIGVAPYRKLIIDYTNVRYAYPATHYNTVQCILYEHTHQIEFQNTVIWGSDEFDYFNYPKQGFCNVGFEQEYITGDQNNLGYPFKVEEAAWLFTPDICDSIVYQTIHVSESDADFFPPSPLCGLDVDTLSTGISGLPTLWSTGDTTESIYIEEEGIYSVIIEGATCTFYDTIEIVFSDPVNLTLSSTPSLAGSNTGTASATALSGTPVFTYLWSNGQTTQTAENIASGLYNVLVTDSKGCFAEDSVFVDEYSLLTEFSGNTFIIYPIPADNYFTISDIAGKYPESVSLINISGKEIYTLHAVTEKYFASDIPDGFYVLQYILNGVNYRGKIVITH